MIGGSVTSIARIAVYDLDLDEEDRQFGWKIDFLPERFALVESYQRPRCMHAVIPSKAMRRTFKQCKRRSIDLLTLLDREYPICAWHSKTIEKTLHVALVQETA